MDNSTTVAPSSADLAIPQYVGFIAVAISVVFFGSNFIPVKKFKTGDGMFFQWVFCIAVWLTGFVVHAIRGFPRFWPLAMLGGFLWTTGNACCVPIIKMVGLGLGLLVWAVFNLLFGWASGRFGWFGIDAQVPSQTGLNYGGVVLCCVSAVLFVFVKPSTERSTPATVAPSPSEEDVPLIVNRKTEPAMSQADDTTFIDRLSPNMKRIIGFSLCAFAGTLFGLNFVPVIYVKNRYPQWYGKCSVSPCVDAVSPNDIDYVFSHFTGILCTSTVYFIIYCIVKKNEPEIYPSSILPALASGAMWGIADICFFLANEALDESISFPMISSGPGIIAAIWGVILFKEIQGVRNLLILGIAFAFTITGAVLCGISK